MAQQDTLSEARARVEEVIERLAIAEGEAERLEAECAELAEAQRAAQMDAARIELRRLREETPDILLRYLNAKAQFILLHNEVLDRRQQVHRQTQILGGDVADVGGPEINWVLVNQHLDVPNEAMLTHWGDVNKLLIRLDLVIKGLGGKSLFPDEAPDEETPTSTAKQEQKRVAAQA